MGVPFPVAHGLIGASVAAALLPSSRSRLAPPLLLGAFLAISPDFDYALNWLQVGRGGWHHGFTHSLPFALVIGFVTIVVLRELKARSWIVFTAAYASHTLLDYVITESRGVALWWPFTDHRYKLRLPNPIDYTWDDSSFWATAVDVSRIVVTELLIFVPVLLVVLLLRRIVVKRARLKQSLGVSVSVLVVMFLTASQAFSQDKQRMVHWPGTPYHANATKSSIATIVPQLDVLEIVDVAVDGKSVTLGETFAAADDWLKNLTVRIKNVSRTTITSVQLNLFLPQIMPGGPMVTLCYGCGNVGKNIEPGEEVEMKTVFYDWLAGEITARSSLSHIDKAEIYEMRVKVLGGSKMLVSQCVKTTKQNNACVPNP